jgi:hypothetical protein
MGEKLKKSRHREEATRQHAMRNTGKAAM